VEARSPNPNARNVVANQSPELQSLAQAAPASASSANATGAGLNEAADNAQALDRIGISSSRDGAIKFDTARFDEALRTDRAAVEETLSRFGQQVETSAERQLSSGDQLERPVLPSTRLDRVNDREARLEEVQREVQQRIETQQQVNQTNNPFLVGGIAAYRGVFAL